MMNYFPDFFLTGKIFPEIIFAGNNFFIRVRLFPILYVSSATITLPDTANKKTSLAGAHFKTKTKIISHKYRGGEKRV